MLWRLRSVPAENDINEYDMNKKHTIQRHRAIQMLRAIGFRGMARWNESKLKKKILKVPENVPKKEFPPEFLAEYTILSVISSVRDLELVGPRYPRRDRPAKKFRDNLGSAFGTYAHRINQALTPSWKNIEDIAHDSGLDFNRARAHLYQMKRFGKVEHRRIIQFRIKEESPE